MVVMVVAVVVVVVVVVVLVVVSGCSCMLPRQRRSRSGYLVNVQGQRVEALGRHRRARGAQGRGSAQRYRERWPKEWRPSEGLSFNHPR